MKNKIAFKMISFIALALCFVTILAYDNNTYAADNSFHTNKTTKKIKDNIMKNSASRLQNGGFGGAVWLDKMTESSTTIVYGTVKSVEPEGSVNIQLIRENQGYLTHGIPVSSNTDPVIGSQSKVKVGLAVIQVEWVIKGSLQLGENSISMKTYQNSSFPKLVNQLKPGLHGLFFLDNNNGPVDIYNPSQILVAEINSPGEGLNPLDQIKYYITASIQPEADYEILEACVDSIIKLQIREAGTNMAALLDSTKPRITSCMLYGLLKLQDSRAFPGTKIFLENPPSDETKNNKGHVIDGISTLTASIFDDDVIGILGIQDASVHQAAVQALRHIRTRKSAIALADVIIDLDTPVDEKYDAMMGTIEWRYGDMNKGQYNSLSLEDQANLPELPGLDLFSKDPDKYLSKWKIWWEKQNSLYINSISF